MAMRSLQSRFAGGVFVLGMASANALAQVAPTTVVMSSAGGISKGSYQAGVDWTISEFLRRQRDGGFRDSVLALLRGVPRAPSALTEFVLGSTSGASAGNINATFAALAWCTRDYAPPHGRRTADVSAEDSLFWRAWVNTGTPGLLPSERNEEAAALSRAFIEERHRQTIWEFMQGATAIPGCRLPVGVTLTRVQPVTVPIDGRAGSVGVQRFASIFNVVANASEPGHTWLDFSAIGEPLASRGSLGALALLPQLERGSAVETIPQRLDAVFAAMLASSAFPVAFAPKELRYVPGGLLKPSPEQREVTAAFSDGGFFDNNPIGLAVGLVEATSKEIRVAYSSPGNYRGALLSARERSVTEPPRSGLGAAAALVSGAFASARDYELQSFLRQIERDHDRYGSSRPRLLVSSRRSPIVGESLSSFGAFLGRSLREYDFYTGVYDGLEFVARYFVCANADAVDIDTCVHGVHARLVRHNSMRLARVAYDVTTWHADAEYPEIAATLAAEDSLAGAKTAGAFAYGAGDAERLSLLRATHDALAGHLNDDRCTGGGDFIASLMCPGGLGAVLAALGGVETAARTLRERQCTAESSARGECSVDQAFLDLIEKPNREVYVLIRRAILNVERGERLQRTNGSKAMAWPAKVAYSAFRSSTMRYRDGVVGPIEFFPSSSALGGDSLVATAIGFVAPGYVHNIVLNDVPDQSALGWQPIRWVVTDRIFVNTQLEFFLKGANADSFKQLSRFQDQLGAGLSVGTFALPRLPALGRPTSLEIGAFRLPDAFPGSLISRGQWAGRLSTRLVLDKLQLTLLVNRQVRSVSFGVSDLNGVAYWIFR